MKLFSGATRRVFIVLPNGNLAHLRRSEKKSTGPVTWCGRLGGWTVGFRGARVLDLCRVCADLSGVAEKLEEAS